MHVRHVRVPVPQTDVPVTMRMRLAGWVVRPMDVLVVLVVDMGVRVLQRVMLMFVLVGFGQMQPDAEGHQHACGEQL